MDGMGFLFQSLGINPDSIKKSASQIQETANAFKAQLDRIELKLDALLMAEGIEIEVNGGLPNGTGISHQGRDARKLN